MIYEPALNLARNIAAKMPGEWRAFLPREDIEYLATIERADGLRLSISRSEGRGHCDPQERPPFGRDMPDLHGFGILGQDEKRPHASFAPDRSAKAICGQITRAVLTPYEPMWRLYLDKVRGKENDRDALASALGDICQTLGTQPHDYATARKMPDYGRCGLGRNTDGASGRFEFSQCQGGTVKVEMRNLTYGEARELARWIAGRNRPLGTRE